MSSNFFRNLVVCVAFIFCISLYSCTDDSGAEPSSLITEERSFESFDKISVGGLIVLNVSRGTEQKVVVRANNDVISKIITEFNEGRLDISLDPGEYNDKTLEVDITLPALTELVVGGAVSTKVQDIQETGNLSITVSGTSNLTIDGTADKLTLDLSGVTQYQGYGLSTQECEISASGTANAQVLCSTLLKGSLTDLSRLSYKGSPTIQVSTSDAAVIINDN